MLATALHGREGGICDADASWEEMCPSLWRGPVPVLDFSAYLCPSFPIMSSLFSYAPLYFILSWSKIFLMD